MSFEEFVSNCLLFICGVLTALVSAQLRLKWRASPPPPPPPPSPAAPSAVAPRLPSAKQALSLIKARRSVKPKDMSGAIIPTATVELLLEAANWAPTHGLTEPWRFVVLDRAACGRLIDMRRAHLERTFDGTASVLAKMVAKIESKRGDLARISHQIAIISKRVPNAKGRMMPQWEDDASVACAVQNLHLLATALNVVGYWTSSGTGRAGYLESEESAAWLGHSPNSGDKCLGLFMLGRTTKDMSKFRSARGPMSAKCSWVSS